MAATAGARFLADSAIWMAAQQAEPKVTKARLGTFMETAIQHMDPVRLASFVDWLEDTRRAE